MGTWKSWVVAVAVWVFVLVPIRALGQLMIENVTIPSFAGQEKLEGVNVYVDGDRIVHVGAKRPPASREIKTRLDGRGKYLIPGFTEMHGHIPHPTRDPQYLEDTLFLFVSRGVTTVRGMLGHPGQLQLRDRISSGQLLGPTLYLASPGFGSNISNPEEAAARVGKYAAEGWDLLKIFDGLSPQEFDAVAKEAAKLKIDFAGHMPRGIGLERILASGMRTIEHLDGYIEYLGGKSRRLPDAALRNAARRTKAGKVGVVPTMAVWDTLLLIPPLETLESYPELKYLPPERARRWREQQGSAVKRLKEAVKALVGGKDPDVISENRRRLLKIMDEEGVEILFGSDAPQRYSMPGFSVIREMRAMARAGLSNARILETATSATGSYFSRFDSFGRIASGARADMILLNGDPTENLETLSDPAGVVLRGRWISSREIGLGLEKIARRNARGR